MGSIRHRRERTILVEQKFGSQTKSPLGKSGAGAKRDGRASLGSTWRDYLDPHISAVSGGMR
jgi:hypothetical protein